MDRLRPTSRPRRTDPTGRRLPGGQEQCRLILAEALADRYRHEHRQADFAAALAALGGPQQDPLAQDNRAVALNLLGTLMLSRCEQSGDPREIAAVERALRHWLGRLPPADPTRPLIVMPLAMVRRRAFEVGGDAEALREAVGLLRSIVAQLPTGSPWRAVLLRNLAAVLRDRVELRPDEAAVQELLRISRTALAEAAADRPEGPDHVAALTGLGVALRIAAEHTDGTELLRESVELLREALRRSAPTSRFHRTTLNSLGNALHRLGQRTGDAALLDEAVEALRQAVAQTPPNDPDAPGRPISPSPCASATSRPATRPRCARPSGWPGRPWTPRPSFGPR